MDKVTCIIVEDEPLAREILSQFISQIPELELVGECSDIHEARKQLNEVQVDLMFLDIQMPEGTGISLLKSLIHPPKVIFTTAYPEFAVEGFDLNAVDYLLKPFSFDRFCQAIEKAYEVLLRTSSLLSKELAPTFLTLKVDKRWIKIEFAEILFIQGFGNYVKVHTHQKVWLTKETMRSIANKLPAREFLQIHKSYICRLRAIDYLEGNRAKIGDQMVPIGGSYKQSLFQAMNSSS